MPTSADLFCFELYLDLLFSRWQPIGGVIWSVEDSTGRLVLLTLFACGWLLVLVSSFLINHFDLFGLRQAWLYLLGRPYSALPFSTPGLYRVVRHPLYVGWLLVFLMAPTMTIAHLLFSVATTAYIVMAIQFEERDQSTSMARITTSATYRCWFHLRIVRLMASAPSTREDNDAARPGGVRHVLRGMQLRSHLSVPYAGWKEDYRLPELRLRIVVAHPERDFRRHRRLRSIRHQPGIWRQPNQQPWRSF